MKKVKPRNGSEKAARASVSLRQAAKYLVIGRLTLKKWTDAGRVPFRRTPTGRYFFALEDLDALRAATGATP